MFVEPRVRIGKRPNLLRLHLLEGIRHQQPTLLTLNNLRDPNGVLPLPIELAHNLQLKEATATDQIPFLADWTFEATEFLLECGDEVAGLGDGPLA